MSRLPVQPKHPKGTLLSPLKTEVFACVQKHPGAHLKKLCEHLPHLAPHQVRDALHDLAAQGHVHSVHCSNTGVRRWRLGPKPQAARPEGVVPPRQIDLMRAPVYVPPPQPPARPGAMGYARYPSNFCGQQKPFRGGL